jgi:Lar family restriction alleviation protein
MNEKLKPCPFCGGVAEIEDDDSQGTNIICSQCNARSPWFDGYYEFDGSGKEKAIKS